IEWVAGFKHPRQLCTFGYISTSEAEANYRRQLPIWRQKLPDLRPYSLLGPRCELLRRSENKTLLDAAIFVNIEMPKRFRFVTRISQ
ncbi:hypothetical protein WG899_05985, partial [Paucibacter sp. AS339]|uniref:hypothetical protein n=1 Tax=Paucibacter hankyongi TaxID=3133434 RepID=UPI0030A5A8A9